MEDGKRSEGMTPSNECTFFRVYIICLVSISSQSLQFDYRLLRQFRRIQDKAGM
jgi:hypothetical protein